MLLHTMPISKMHIQSSSFQMNTLPARNIQSNGTSENLVLIIVLILVPLPGPILSNWNFDPLCRKAFTQICALNHTWEALGTVDGEDLAEASREDGSFARINSGHSHVAGAGSVI